MSLHLIIVTPEKTVVDDDIDELIVPTTTGELTILPHHVPLVTQIASGVINIKKNGREEIFAVDGGFLQVGEKEIIVLADYAASGKDISAIKAEEAKKAAERAMKEKKSDVDFAQAEAEFRRAILELKIAGLHKKRV